MNKKTPLTPEEIFDAAMAEQGPDISPEKLRLLRSGLAFLREREAKINHRRALSLTSLIIYTAHKQQISQETVASVFLAQFKLDALEDLPMRLYENAIRFIVDLDVTKMIN
ncbi:MAG: hypothetical protein AB7S81_01970 [Bdellovibrionales bacterium]